ncbi:zf-HC2 domain-containing protein [Streptomycetaceae bacterium NBC_01309]
MPLSCEEVRSRLAAYRLDTLSLDRRREVGTHMAECVACRQDWNKHRWDSSARHTLVEELKMFLGPTYIPYFDPAWVENEQRGSGLDGIDTFRRSMARMYGLAVWGASGSRPDYVEAGIPLLWAAGVRTIVDYGCGLGNDAIPLAKAGFSVTGDEVDSASLSFMLWRLRRRPTLMRPRLQPVRSAPVPDAIWAIHALHLLTDEERHVWELLRSVRIVVTENLLNRYDPGMMGYPAHLRRRSPTDVASLLQDHGFSAENPSSQAPVIFWTRRTRTLGLAA